MEILNFDGNSKYKSNGNAIVMVLLYGMVIVVIMIQSNRSI